MTTEEKARAYAGDLKVSKAIPGVMIPMIADMVEAAYLAGATEALASQWKDPKVEPPEDDETVFVSDENGFHIATYFNGEWYSSDDEFTRNPQMWLPIPPLKGDPDTFDETDK